MYLTRHAITKIIFTKFCTMKIWSYVYGAHKLQAGYTLLIINMVIEIIVPTYGSVVLFMRQLANLKDSCFMIR